MESQRIELIVESDRELTEKLSKFKRYLATEGHCCSVKSCLKPFTFDYDFSVFSKTDICVRGYTGAHFGYVDVCYSCAYVEGTRDYGFHTINRDKVIQ
jgi:hypothetical protein